VKPRLSLPNRLASAIVGSSRGEPAGSGGSLKPQLEARKGVPKKGLLALVMLISLIALGSWLAGYYTWTVTYQINPLTEHLKIHIESTGATHSPKKLVEETFIEVLKPGDYIVTLVGCQLSDVDDAFQNLTIQIEIWDWNQTNLIASKDFVIVESEQVNTHDQHLIATLDPGKYKVKIYVEHMTQPVQDGSVSGSFHFLVYMVEAKIHS